MLNFKVRTYNPEKETPENSIFILSRGRNAGQIDEGDSRIPKINKQENEQTTFQTLSELFYSVLQE